MVNYPTILNLPQKDINRQLYERVLKLQVKAKYHVLSLTVNDGTDPISGATVVIGETTKTTGTSGGCTFPDMPYDTYSATVSAEGYTSKTESIVFDATHKSFTISLSAAVSAGTVTVTCQDSTQNPITDARVYLSSHSTFDWEDLPSELEYLVGFGMSDETTGIATLHYYDGTQEPTGTDIPFGSYYLYAKSELGSEEYSGTLTVDGDETVTITLIPIDGGDK